MYFEKAVEKVARLHNTGWNQQGSGSSPDQDNRLF